MAQVLIKCADPVRVTCYNQTKIWERKDAVKFYGDCARYTEGSERDRYLNIYFQLLDGAKEASDC